MGIELKDKNRVIDILCSHGFHLESSVMDDTNFILKMKYELMRHDVNRDLDYYFKNIFIQRLQLFCDDSVLIIPKIIINLSNRCTLQCKKCSMLMPYFQNRWEINSFKAINNIDVFLRGVDEVLNFNIIGGEPFLYKDLSVILQHVIDSEKIKHIVIFTNGTLLPDSNVIPFLQNNKVQIVLSDYGNIVQMAKFVDFVERLHINLNILSNINWIDFGGIFSRNRSEETLKENFSNCIFSYNCKTLFENRLYICERSARMHAFNNSIYDSSRDYVTLNYDDDPMIIRKKIIQLYSSNVADACNHCDAGLTDTRTIVAGEQINGEYFRSSYTIVKRTDL